ncbi:sn-glycerol-3-phosphate import ATP-binding protein UgpC [Salinarimonas sp.]|uniref:sn-glycerol-3-phosphate import ATP-binding protein UgpC n=1 Tax=Salinarimonas sp. TaxID=2766526 RepID=UPI00391AB123
MATIDIRSVRKSYLTTEVIKGIDCSVRDGELLVMLGPSGCGKSTLLRMVAGLERISKGEIAIDGRVVNELEPKDRNIAMVFQNYALYPHMSVFENMAYGLRIKGMPKAEIQAAVERAAKILELSAYLDRKPRQLSGGQRQRVAMGRAIVRSPSVFLFDEPLSNLDAKLRTQMRIEIKKLQTALGITSLYVTHDQVEAMTLADRIMVMNSGVAEQIDTPMNVYAHPASIFVAGFIGSPAMNFVGGSVGADGVSVALESGAALRDLPRPVEAARGRPVTLGIRPEHLEIVPIERADLRLEAVLVETLGADTVVHGTLIDRDGTALAVAGEGGRTLAARVPGHVRVVEGEVLPLRIADGALHLFDRETGLRIAEG